MCTPLIKWSVNFRDGNLHYFCPKFLIHPTHFRQLGNTSFLFCVLLSHSLKSKSFTNYNISASLSLRVTVAVRNLHICFLDFG